MNHNVLYSTQDKVATITLNRPHRLNAINPELLCDFQTALDSANCDPDVRTIVLCGEGRAFCAGDDLKELNVKYTPRHNYNRVLIENDFVQCYKFTKA